VSRLGVEERAVSIVAFDERDATADQPRMLRPHLFNRLAKDCSHLGEFLFGDPDDTGLTRAAIPALSARER
jgi:hypothetical protein